MRGLLVTCALAATSALAAPYRPASDEQVLGTISPAPARITGTADITAAAQRARDHIGEARRSGDVRHLGYAEGVLRPWWDAAAPPPPILLLRATLRQSRHEFAAAARDLDAVLNHEPNNVQALLTLAAVQRVRGRVADALAACRRLQPHTGAFVGALCLAAARGVGGELGIAAMELERIAQDSMRQPAAVRTWFAVERGDVAERLGDPRRALAVYAAALGQGLDDAQLRAAAADVLLQLGRPDDARQLLGEAPQSDALRLRAALAARAAGRSDTALEAALEDSFAAARRRGTAEHLREEVRYQLELRSEPALALRLAQRNWETQREPVDARLLAAAAVAAGRPHEANPVRLFLASTKLQDAKLDALLGQRP